MRLIQRAKPYAAGLRTFVVSPVNARKALSDFIKKASKQLLIYDPEIGDAQMIRLLEDRAKAGVEIKIIGRIGKRGCNLVAEKLAKLRLHTRTIIRDQHQAFVGSQSLRQAELDSRREVGLIVHDAKVVRSIVGTFEADWSAIEQEKNRGETTEPGEGPNTKKMMKKAVKALVNDLPPLAPIVKEVVKEVVEKAGNNALNQKEVQATVKEAVREAVKKEEVKEAIKEAIKEVLQDPKEPY